MWWHKEASQLIGKKPKCYGIKKYLALKYSPLIYIRNDSQEGKNWSATISKQSYNAKQH